MSDPDTSTPSSREELYRKLRELQPNMTGEGRRELQRLRAEYEASAPEFLRPSSSRPPSIIKEALIQLGSLLLLVLIIATILTVLVYLS